MASKTKWLSPTYLWDDPYTDPTNPLVWQWQWPSTLYPVSVVPDDPLRWRLSDTIDYNVGLISTPSIFVRRLSISWTGNLPQNATVWLWFTPSLIIIRAFQSWSWGYSESFVDLTKAKLYSWTGISTYTTYVSSVAINRAEDTTNAINVASGAWVTATIWLINNWFNINVTAYTSAAIVHYIAYQ